MNTLLILFLLLTRYYWPTSVSTLSHGLSKHTHAAVRGDLIRVYLEADGDRHAWIRDTVTADSVVVECIPKLPCVLPSVGTRATYLGITRKDPEHGWYELHPVEAIQP